MCIKVILFLHGVYQLDDHLQQQIFNKLGQVDYDYIKKDRIYFMYKTTLNSVYVLRNNWLNK